MANRGPKIICERAELGVVAKRWWVFVGVDKLW